MLTLELMESLFPTEGLNPRKFNLVRERAKLVETMNRVLPEYGIKNFKRVVAFLGNCGIETDYFRTTEEYASGAAYEGRSNLGNFLSGDGRRFKGRDLTQTTGRYNYWRVVCRFVKKLTGKDFSKDLNKYADFAEYLQSADYDKLLTEADRLGVNYLAHPEKLAEIEIAVESACIFWSQQNLNDYADRGEFKQLSGIVNRGDEDKTPLHWEKRNLLYSKCKRVIPKDFTISATLPLHKEDEPIQQVTDNSINTNLPATQETDVKPGDSSSDFLTTVIDQNLTPDQVKTTTLSFGQKLWRGLIRPLSMLYAALEAGNIYAWLGVALAVIFTAYLIYSHRADLKKLFLTLKNKLK